MIVDILTLFPGMFDCVLSESILGRAQKNGALEIRLHDIRDYTLDRHRKTDDYPFGGGAGMVMMAQPVVDCFAAVDPERKAKRIYLSPRGRSLTQKTVEKLSKEQHLALLCGHYEGVDQRALDLCVDEELSIGDYILTGGELGAMVLVDAVARLLPGVLGCSASVDEESFTTGLLEYPQYTRPASFRGNRVPDVLLGGDHADISRWRREQSLDITRRQRPDLLKTAPLDEKDTDCLKRMAASEQAIMELENRGIKACRRSLLEADAFPRRWLERFVSAEKLREAKKRCLSGRKRTGLLIRAFTEHFIETPQRVKPTTGTVSNGILYLSEERVLLELRDAHFDLRNLPFPSFIWVDEAETATWCPGPAPSCELFYARAAMED